MRKLPKRIYDIRRFRKVVDAPGTILKRCSQEFLRLFTAADLILSKGQGNLESLSSEDAPIYFLLKVKCPVIARHLGAQTGEMILKNSWMKPSFIWDSHGRLVV